MLLPISPEGRSVGVAQPTRSGWWCAAARSIASPCRGGSVVASRCVVAGALDWGLCPAPSSAPVTARQGTLNCGSLEALWRSAGGAPWAEVTAASIAMAESGGRQYATGAAGERGYWQINPVNGALSTYSAYGNARSAVIMSRDGTDWYPWTTWVDRAYAGRC